MNTFIRLGILSLIITAAFGWYEYNAIKQKYFNRTKHFQMIVYISFVAMEIAIPVFIFATFGHLLGDYERLAYFYVFIAVLLFEGIRLFDEVILKSSNEEEADDLSK